MRLAWGIAGVALLGLAGCGDAPDTAEAPAASQMDATEAAVPSPTDAAEREASGESEALVQPEWDVLDRVEDTCGMSGLRDLLGEQVENIPEGRLPQQHRILSPTDRPTMDYVADRLNILTNESGMIIGFKCG